jgi:formyl-CoA transferase
MRHEVPVQAGNNHPTSIPTGVFTTADGHINVATTGQVMWERFCRAAGLEPLLQRPDYASAAARSQNRDALNAAIDARLKTRSSADWVACFNEAGVPCGPIYSIDQTFADPQVQHLGMAQSVTRPDGQAVRVVGQPIALSRTPSRIAAAPPDIGQHTDEVLAEFGYSASEIAALRQAKVV